MQKKDLCKFRIPAKEKSLQNGLKLRKAVKVGSVKTVNGSKYKVTSASSKSRTVMLTKAGNASNVVIPEAVKLSDDKTYKVTAIGAKAFRGSKIRKVTLGKNVKKIKAYAFKGLKTSTVTLKTKLLKKSAVKNSLKSSKVRTVRVSITKKAGKTNRTYVKKYKKYFTKNNAGRNVTVKMSQ